MRRALHVAGEELNWKVLAADDPAGTQEVKADVRRLTQAGIRQLERDLEAEIVEKRQEVRRLKKTLAVLSDLAEQDEEAFPTQLEYQYTSNRGRDDFVTKTEEVVLEAPDDAGKAAKKIEQRLDRFGRLRDQMVEQLKDQRKTIAEAKADLQRFVLGVERMLDDVLAILT